MSASGASPGSLHRAARFARATALLGTTRDIVSERPAEREPAWVEARRWGPFLAGLDERRLDDLERRGLAAAADDLNGAPNDLRELAAEVREVTSFALPFAGDGQDVDARRASIRKRSQVAAFAELVRPLLPGIGRVIDVGSGHGHLTRHLARQLDVPVEGWEIDEARVAVATTLPAAEATTFRGLDVRDALGELGSADLVIGLHACGELADNAVRAAARAGASVAIVGCCLQKRRGERLPTSHVDARPLSRDVLGLGNVALGDRGVEEPLRVRLRSRENRIALRLVLEASGVPTLPGEEMRGLNRRRATGSLDDLVADCFAARGLPPPSPALVAAEATLATEIHARRRRWDLPRTMLGRLIEVWVAADRAAALAETGHEADVRLAFDAAESPRNLAVIARRTR